MYEAFIMFVIPVLQQTVEFVDYNMTFEDYEACLRRAAEMAVISAEIAVSQGVTITNMFDSCRLAPTGI